MGDFQFFLGYVLFAVLVFSVGVALMMWWDSRRPETEGAKDFAGVEDQIERLLRSGRRWAYVIFYPLGFDGFLQFRKYIRAKGDYGIELGFPDADWSRAYVAPLHAWCVRNNTPLMTVVEQGSVSMNVIYVDCGRDVEKACRLVKGIMAEVFGLPFDGLYRCYEHGIDPLGTRINAPRPDETERAPGYRDQRGHMGPSLGGGCAGALIGTLGVLALFALYYGLLMRGLDLFLPLGIEWATVRITGFGLAANVVVYDAVCIGLVYLSFNAFEWTELARDAWLHRIVRWARASPWWRLGRRLIRLALRAPILVAVLTWFAF